MAEKGDMESWEFLLQKEGDRTWLPLENSTVEILEGRYRVVARTPCAQEEVDIYVSFISSEDSPPKRRIQQRSYAANDDGLLAILPFTPFRPGRWELRCRPHVEAGEPAQQWPSQIQLEVLPQALSDDDDLFGWGQPEEDGADSQITTTDAPTEGPAAPAEADSVTEPESAIEPQPGLDAEPAAEPEPTATASAPLSAADLDPATASEADIRRLAAEMSQMVAASAAPPQADSSTSPSEPDSSEPALSDTVSSNTAPFSTAASDLSDSPPAPPNVIASDAATSDIAISDPAEPALASGTGAESNAAVVTESDGIAIALAEAVVVMDGDRQVTVQGQITGAAAPSSSSGDLAARQAGSPTDKPLPAELLLTIELRDPSTTEIWASYRESFQQAKAPISFASDLQVPAACRTQLFLGNATLWQVESDGRLERLLSQDFSAMAAVDSLLDQARQSAPVAASGGLQSGAVNNLQQQAASNFLVTKFGAEPQLSKGNVQINTELLNLIKPASPGAGGSARERPRVSRSHAVEAQPANRPRLELPSFGNASRVSLPSANRLADDLAEQGPDYGLSSPGVASPAEAFGGEIYMGESFAGETFEAETVPVIGEEAVSEAISASAPVVDEDNPFVLSLDEPALDDASDAAVANSTVAAPAEGAAQGLGLDAIFLDDELGQASALDPAQSAPPEQRLAAADSMALSVAPESALERVQASPSSSSVGFAHEVVVDDEDTVPQGRLAWMQPSDAEGLVDANVAVPAPELTVPDGALVKGETVRIQVRVAQEPARLCARVWLLDCQSRTLLGEPQWITAFLPLGDRWLEANVELVIPEGSIELQVEAIAVEPVTQRESRKVSTRRKVKLDGIEPDAESW